MRPSSNEWTEATRAARVGRAGALALMLAACGGGGGDMPGVSNGLIASSSVA
jgi:hypothetical protein